MNLGKTFYLSKNGKKSNVRIKIHGGKSAETFQKYLDQILGKEYKIVKIKEW